MDLKLVVISSGDPSPLNGHRKLPAGMYASYDVKRGYAEAFSSSGKKLTQTGGGPSLTDMIAREGAKTVFLYEHSFPARITHMKACLRAAGHTLREMSAGDYLASIKH
jgi:hypothetical protein